MGTALGATTSVGLYWLVTADRLDMTEEMLALARRNAAQTGVTNVDFLKGHIEQIPLPADTVDVVISNCVVNLSVDKPAVFAEIHRGLKPGGASASVTSSPRTASAQPTEQRGRRCGTLVHCSPASELF